MYTNLCTNIHLIKTNSFRLNLTWFKFFQNTNTWCLSDSWEFLIQKWTAPTWWMICYWFFSCPVHWPALPVLPAPGRFCTELQYLLPSLPFPVNQMYSKMEHHALNNNTQVYEKTNTLCTGKLGKPHHVFRYALS